MTAKLTSEIIDSRLLTSNRLIKRIGNYINNYTNIFWECSVEHCHYIWLAAPRNIFKTYKPTGCPQCAGNVPLSNNKIDEKLLLFNRNLKRLGDYAGIHIPINWKCKNENCSYIWKAEPNYILNYDGGCPKCYGNIKLTNKIIDEKLLINNISIKRIGNVNGNKNPIEWKSETETCNHHWFTTPDNILNSYSGCPICKNTNEKLIYDILKINNVQFEYQKYIKTLNSNELSKYRVDFYFQQYNLIVEYNGSQHYEPKTFGILSQKQANDNFIRQEKRDEYIRCFCKTHNIQLLEIDGRKYKGKKLESYIKQLIENHFYQKGVAA